MDIVTIETPSLGDRTYVVIDGDVAAVIDPQRDIDRVLEVLESRGATLEAAFETHVHNDYVTGGYQLARTLGAAYHLHADEDVAFEHESLRDGDEVKVGTFVIRAVHTPGHTPTHLSYVLSDGQDDVAVFTGGSMLYGSVGRTDLISEEMTEGLTRSQYRSVRRLADLLDDETEVRPTHGFGSFCSSGDTAERGGSTIGQERRDNQALQIDDEDDFVAELLAGLDAYPAYYAHMAPLNRRGPAPVDLSPVELVDVTELKRRIHAGEWVVDLRSRTAFAHAHLHGTINIELADSASTYLGWLIEWGTPVTLIGDSEEQVAEMQRQLVRIGIDRPTGQRPDGVDGIPAADLAAYRTVGFIELREAVEAGADPWVLDARMQLEWSDRHIDGAHHIPLHELLARLDEIPSDREVWVHCASGYRASIAASLLARSGRRPVLVDGQFDELAPDLFDLTVDAS